ncbi:MAG: ABC-type transport auxiliary lipoprotein family protein [Sphingorhabdus sp.]
MTGSTRPRWLSLSAFTALGAAFILTGCVNFGGSKAPPALLVLTAEASVAGGTVRSGERKEALVVLPPEAPRKLETVRVPVQVNASSIAYLKDAVWADKPAKLWQQLLAETIAARTDLLVLNNFDAGGRDRYQLSGMLMEFGIDADSNEAVIVFDAVKLRDAKPVEKRRFEIRKPVALIEAGPVGEALNAAANELAAEVSDWVK